MAKSPRKTANERKLGVTLLTGLGFALATAATGAAAILIGRRRKRGEGHAAPDLTGDTRPAAEDRAPEAFRPDPTATPTAAEKEALRPATMAAPSPAQSDPVVEPVAPEVPVRPLTPAS